MEPTFDGLDTLPGPVDKATIWKNYGGATGGQSPPTSATSAPAACSRWPARSTATPRARPRQGAFPRYYNGSWLINNRGADNGFWKEVKMRQDNNQMLRVNDWLPYNGGVNPTAPTPAS